MISEDEKRIIMERLLTMPPSLKLSIGEYGSFDKNQLINEINQDSKIGEFFIRMHMEYLQSFKKEIE